MNTADEAENPDDGWGWALEFWNEGDERCVIVKMIPEDTKYTFRADAARVFARGLLEAATQADGKPDPMTEAQEALEVSRAECRRRARALTTLTHSFAEYLGFSDTATDLDVRHELERKAAEDDRRGRLLSEDCDFWERRSGVWRRLAKRLRARTPTPRWVSVELALPDDGRRVAVCNTTFLEWTVAMRRPEHHVTTHGLTGARELRQAGWYDVAGKLVRQDITHWMDCIPQVPSECDLGFRPVWP